MIMHITGLPCVGNFSLTKQILWKTTVSSELLKHVITNYKIVCLYMSDNAVTEWLKNLENTKKIKDVSYTHLNIMGKSPYHQVTEVSLYFQFHSLKTHIQQNPSETNPQCCHYLCMKWTLVFINRIGLRQLECSTLGQVNCLCPNQKYP